MRFVASLAMAFVMLAPAPAAAGEWTWPVDGELATEYRNGDDPYAAGQHRGIDIAAPAGRQVAAAASGTVTFAGTVGSAGATVTVRTADGRLDTSYLHLGSIDVREGETVSAGAALGEVGASGRGSIDQPHLHFGVREVDSRHAYRDPLEFLPIPKAPPSVQPPPPPAPVPVAPPARPGPAPVRAPVPVESPRPVESPAPELRPSPTREPLPAPRVRLPLPGPGGARRTMPRPVAVPERIGSPQLRPLPIPGSRRPRAPAHGDARAPTGGDGRSGSPAHGASEPRPVPASGPHAGDRHGSPERPVSGALPAPGSFVGGLDKGWLVACLGLGLVAVALVRRDSILKGAAFGRAALAAALRPLMRGS